jgi:hypothetical protein
MGTNDARLSAPERMTDETPPIRQISGNFEKFQGGRAYRRQVCNITLLASLNLSRAANARLMFFERTIR